MKKFYALALLMVAGLSYGQATLPFVEHFNYATGSNLGGQGGWTNLNSGDEVLVAANSLSFPGFGASAGNSVTFGATGIDPQLAITPQTAGVVYASYLLNVTDISNLSFANGSYHFGLGTGTNFVSTVWIKPVTGSTTEFNIGINKRTTAADAVYNPTSLAVNQTYLVVIAFDIDNQTSSMWINPASSTFGNTTAPTSTLIATTGSNVTTVDKAFIRQGSATDTPAVIIFDELRIGTTWASVTPAATGNTKENNIAGLKMYPNPLSGNVLNITSISDADKTVAIFDVLGKQVLNGKVTNGTVNVSALTSGVYIVKVTEEGKTATRKLVVR